MVIIPRLMRARLHSRARSLAPPALAPRPHLRLPKQQHRRRRQPEARALGASSVGYRILPRVWRVSARPSRLQLAVCNPISPASRSFFARPSSCLSPFGVEQSVAAAGPLPVFIAIALLPMVWAIPQALITAELASMVPDNGGCVVWVQAAFGDFAGWMVG